MDLKEIQKLIKMVESAEISEFEIEEKGNKIRISKNNSANSNNETHIIPTMMPQMQAPVAAAPAAAPVADSASAPTPAKNDNVIEVRSPMVGTFYRAAGPDSDPYTDVNKTVKAGDVLCIVEAMKLMNEIESEVSGKIVEILVQNAQPVEYNQVLFLVEKG
ncbi:MAG: acetyl-CoA carboxylase biotin carboxyl carrier protein [Calditrichaeota bacterium]|nr:MAG: acetyl-CoA carboxylase biotin carboxyl carrier protein [Calditrichota bacterium]MBL1207379.1 acetyl-CoA carboxylase biotin carboxyl carrier protein [Calditrichota bacterium]NOG47211.1 acetyl-CoA carboxylase biotin carboxyl carrier protein [Calditrichota bacterium]